MPSPQYGRRQSIVQVSALEALPSSHSSYPGAAGLTISARCTWSPQVAVRQPLVQASVSVVLPSSHCSPASTTPLPQQLVEGAVQRISWHWALQLALVGSQVSGHSMMLLPQVGMVQT